MYDANAPSAPEASKGKGKGRRTRKGAAAGPAVPEVSGVSEPPTDVAVIAADAGSLKRPGSPSQEDRPAKVSGVFPLGLVVFWAEC